MIELFKEPKVIALVGDTNTGKSNLLYYLLHTLKEKYAFKTYAYGLRLNIEGVQQVHSVPELERVKDSLIIVDEMASLFDLDNRKSKRLIENMLRLIFHNNNVLVLSGVGENFKKFISGKTHVKMYKQLHIADLINGSSIKTTLLDYKGNELGSSVLALDKDEVLIHDGEHYQVHKVPYMAQYDTKKENKPIMCKKTNNEVIKVDL